VYGFPPEKFITSIKKENLRKGLDIKWAAMVNAIPNPARVATLKSAKINRTLRIIKILFEDV
jgi:hypothetical protein